LELQQKIRARRCIPAAGKSMTPRNLAVDSRLPIINECTFRERRYDEYYTSYISFYCLAIVTHRKALILHQHSGPALTHGSVQQSHWILQEYSKSVSFSFCNAQISLGIVPFKQLLCK